MTSVCDAILNVHDAVLKARYLAEIECDSRLFHLRRLGETTARLTSGMHNHGPADPVFSSTRAATSDPAQNHNAQNAAPIARRQA